MSYLQSDFKTASDERDQLRAQVNRLNEVIAAAQDQNDTPMDEDAPAVDPRIQELEKELEELQSKAQIVGKNLANANKQTLRLVEQRDRAERDCSDAVCTSCST